MSPVEDAIHDALLTAHGYMPAWDDYDIIGGAMQVHQRGTSTAGITTGGYYTADRWTTGLNGIGTWTHSVENDAPTGSGFRKSWKTLCTTADASPSAAEYFIAQQAIEGQNLQSIKKGTADAEQLTLSFWVKSNKTGTYIAALVDSDNARHVSASYTIDASGTWERKVITFPADTTGAFDNDNAASLSLHFWLAAGSDWTSGTLGTTWTAMTNANRAVGQTNLASDTNNYWQVTGVQLEVGSAATGFEFKGYEQELAECQRYFNMVAPVGINNAVGVGSYFSAGTVLVPITINMRDDPALVADTTAYRFTLYWDSVADTITASALTPYTTYRIAFVEFTGGAGSVGQSGQVFTNNANAYLALSADL